jgi:peptidoglycan/LPS O-acetylase OafA/YrhL
VIGAKNEKVRADIQALRAVAVLGVVLFHLWPDRIPGGYIGVDVFFAISGFLITSHLVREIKATGRIALSQFYARRIRRLLPAAMLVLAATLVSVILLVPRAQFHLFLTQIAASALYCVNWVLAANSVDYFAADDAVSPVQHYWSLSVEEQFYLIWPILLLLAVVVTRRASPAVRGRVIFGLLTVIFAVCLVYSIFATADSQQFAYFSTPAHGWEFAAGGMLAIVLPRVAPTVIPRLRAVGGWLGFAAIAASMFIFTGDSPFPGYIALLPIGGVILVMASATDGISWSPYRLIRFRPVQFIGDVSYSLYLWHWPIIVLVPYVTGVVLHSLDKVGILAVSILLAYVTKRVIEDPVRTLPRLRPRRVTYAMAAAMSVVVVAGCAVPIVMTNLDRQALQTALQAQDQHPPEVVVDCEGAAAMTTPDVCPDSHILPAGAWTAFAITDSQSNWMSSENDPFYTQTCAKKAGTLISVCTLGSNTPDRVILLIGDSHANHLTRPLAELAKRYNWQLISIWRSSCRPVLQEYESNVKAETLPGCQRWKTEFVDAVIELKPDVIVTSGATQGYHLRPQPPKSADVAAAFQKTWQPWIDAGIPVLAVSDVPTIKGIGVPDCIDKAKTNQDPCTHPRKTELAPDPILIAADAIDNPKLVSLSLYDYFCDATTCHTVVGGLVTNKDSNHMTSTFASTLAPYIYTKLRQLLDQ